MRVAFMTTMGRNVGDEFIREGFRSFFDEAIGAYEPYYVDKHDLTTLHRPAYDEGEVLADKFRDADVIVQAGAPVYWTNRHSQSYSAEWAQALWYDRIFKLAVDKPILNLGAGSGQKSEDDLDTLMADAKLIEFARQAGDACAWTTARDPLAAEFLEAVAVKHELLPCPAFHTARRVPQTPANNLLAINLMPKAGHYRLKSENDPRRWRKVIDEALPRLRREHRLLFVAHDASEAEFQQQLALDGESVFVAHDWRDYLSLYGRVKGIVANRVHGAVCVAGFGRPAVIIGNDARIGIARPIGVSAIDSGDVSADWIVESLQREFRDHDLCRRRLKLREDSAARYVQRIRERVQTSTLAVAA